MEHSYQIRMGANGEKRVFQIRADGKVRMVDASHAGFVAWSKAHDPEVVPYEPPPLDALREAKKAEIDAAYGSALNAGLPVLGYLPGSGEEPVFIMAVADRDLLRMRFALEYAVERGLSHLRITNAFDETFSVTLETAQKIRLEMEDGAIRLDTARKELWAAIARADTPEEAARIAWIV